MKKHFLILFIALFALGVSQSFAQPITITPTPLDPNCIDLDNPLTPVPGNPYTYNVNVPTPPGNKSYRWYVTQDQNFAVSGAYNWGTAEVIGTSGILAAGDVHYNILTADSSSISLTWQSFVLAPDEYVFVVIYVENESSELPGCTTNNLKVYRIQPLHAFTLDIANVDPVAVDSVGDGFQVCIDDVQSAVFDPLHGTNGGIVYDYGTNTLYYAVAAANFSGQYRLFAQFDGLQAVTPDGADGQIATIYWDYVYNGETNSVGPLDLNDNLTELDLGVVEAQDATGTVGAGGEVIYIKVVINHNSFEAAGGVDSYPYTLAINGRLVDASGVPLAPATDPELYDDLHYADCAPDGFINDIVSQSLIARPTINAVDPDFLPIAP
jgi:hypothetical protein